MELSNDEKLEILYTSMKLLEKESRLKDELIAALKEQNTLLETRIAQLLSMTDKPLVAYRYGLTVGTGHFLFQFPTAMLLGAQRPQKFLFHLNVLFP